MIRGQVLRIVELEMLVDAEPLAQRAGEHAASRRRPDDRELLQGEIDRPRRHPLAQDHVDPEILHDRIDELLDGAGQAVDLVDEEDRALGRVREVGHHVHLLVERRPAGDIQLDPKLVVQDHGEGRLAQPRRPIEEDMGQGLAPLLRRGQADGQPFGHGALADHFGEPLGAEFLVRVDGPYLGRLRRVGDIPAFLVIPGIRCPFDDGLSHRSVLSARYPRRIRCSLPATVGAGRAAGAR